MRAVSSGSSPLHRKFGHERGAVPRPVADRRRSLLRASDFGFPIMDITSRQDGFCDVGDLCGKVWAGLALIAEILSNASNRCI